MFNWLKKLRARTLSNPPPISHSDLRALFDFLDRPNPPPCKHDHRETIQFLKSRQLPIESTIAWLRVNGGLCDCEVIFNVTDRWGAEVEWAPTRDE